MRINVYIQKTGGSVVNALYIGTCDDTDNADGIREELADNCHITAMNLFPVKNGKDLVIFGE